jgi:hypothetical protein
VKRHIIQVTDDLHEQEGKHVEADGEHWLALDHRCVRLDLTDPHFADLLGELEDYFAAGEPMTEYLVKLTVEPRKTKLGLAREHNERMRAWGNENGFPVEHRGPGRGYYHSDALKKAYAAAHPEDVIGDASD